MFVKRHPIALAVGAAIVALLMAAAPADAARGGGGRGGGGGGWGGGRGGGGGGWGYGGWDRGWGIGLGYGGYWPGYYGGYYSGYYPYYNTGYYDTYYSPNVITGASPFYYDTTYAPSTVQYSTPSLYYSPSNTDMNNNQARIEVRVPDANAQVLFNGDATQQRGADRTFVTPALNGSGTYNIEARWMENGKQVDRTQKVTVTPGQTTQVNFNE